MFSQKKRNLTWIQVCIVLLIAVIAVFIPVSYTHLPVKEEAKVEATEEPKADKKISASMKKDELIAFANEHDIEVDEKATKAVIIETIEAALK